MNVKRLKKPKRGRPVSVAGATKETFYLSREAADALTVLVKRWKCGRGEAARRAFVRLAFHFPEN